MTLRTVGALPATQLHPGLVLALDGLEVRLGQLRGRRDALQAQIAAILDVDIDIGEITARLNLLLDADFAAGVELDALQAVADAAVKIQADIDVLLAAQARLDAKLGSFTAALNIAGIHAWAYEGAAGRFATQLANATVGGFGAIAPGNDIRGAILASSSAANWAVLSGALFTGYGSVSSTTGSDPGIQESELHYLGSIPGNSLLIGLGVALPEVQAEAQAIADAIADLQAEILALASLNVGVGISLAASAALAGIASFGIPVPTISADLAAELTILIGLILVLEGVVSKVSASITGSGVHLWTYEGTAGALGSEFVAETNGSIAGGRPEDTCYGLVLATDSVTDFAALNAVLRVQ